MSGGYFGVSGASEGVGVSEVYFGWQVDWGPDHIGPQSQAPSTPTGSPGGVTYLAKAKQVTEMSSAGYYIHLELYVVTIFICGSMPPYHIFLHAILRNVLWTIFSADQFAHILTQSI